MSTKATLLSTIGGLSKPSKMPCHGYSLPAQACFIGSRLRQIKGSTCSHCYARKGRYAFPAIKAALARRLAALNADRDAWQRNITQAIKLCEHSGFFRWHDSGDLQDMDHLERIIRIAKALPDIRFWLPTKEYRIMREWTRRDEELPSNLTIRISAPMIGGKAPMISGLPTAECSKDGDCLAPKQGGKCLDCRRCWDKSITTITYAMH